MDCIGVGQDRVIGCLERNSTLSRPRIKWDDIIEIDLQEMGCRRMDCIGVGQDREMGKIGGK